MQSCDVEGFGAGVVTHATVGPLSIADLNAGEVVDPALRIPYTSRQYVRLNYTVATGPFTGGKITAIGATGRQTNV